MSQQQAGFEEDFRDGPKDASYAGYAGAPRYSTYSAPAPGQRPLTQDIGHTSKMPGPGQRLALAIISLLVVLVGLVVTAVAASSLYYTAGVITLAVAFFLFLVLSVVVVIINLVFGRAH